MRLVAAVGLAMVLLGSSHGGAAPPACTVRGTSGNHVLRGTPGRDTICALGGTEVDVCLNGKRLFSCP